MQSNTPAPLYPTISSTNAPGHPPRDYGNTHQSYANTPINYANTPIDYSNTHHANTQQNNGNTPIGYAPFFQLDYGSKIQGYVNTPQPTAPPPPTIINTNGTTPPGYFDVIDKVVEPSKGHKIKELIERYEIDPLFSEKLDILSEMEIVLLLDDSGSMNTPLTDGTGHSTRWDELKSVVNIVISIASLYDEDGVDIHFLNRPPQIKIKSLDQVDTILNDPPHGSTPLTRNLDIILDKFKNSSKSVLIIIATDGLPNKSGYSDLDNFKQLLLHKNHSKFYVSFLACSDQDQDVGYLNELDIKVPNVDTLDDYASELKEVKAVQGKDFSYTFGDHVVRLLLGPLCPELDKLDESKLSSSKSFRCGRCIIL
jgi:hypothetical protein